MCDVDMSAVVECNILMDVTQVFDFALNSLTVQFVSEDPQPGGFLRISKLFR